MRLFQEIVCFVLCRRKRLIEIVIMTIFSVSADPLRLSHNSAELQFYSALRVSTDHLRSSDNLDIGHYEARCAPFIKRNRQVSPLRLFFSAQRCKSAAILLTLLWQLPWLALMLRAAAACPIFGFGRHTMQAHHSLYSQLHALLRIRPFHTPRELAMWLWRDDGLVACRDTQKRQRLQLLCFVQHGVIVARLCFHKQRDNDRDAAVFCRCIIRRYVSTRGADHLLRLLSC